MRQPETNTSLVVDFEHIVENSDTLDENSTVPPIILPIASTSMNYADLNFSDNASTNNVNNETHFAPPHVGNNQLLLSYSVRHKISDSALTDLLN